MLIETFVDHKRAEVSFRSALLSQNKLHCPATDISPLHLPSVQRRPGRAQGQRSGGHDPWPLCDAEPSWEIMSATSHTRTLRNMQKKTYLGYFLCGIMGRISKSSLDSGRSSCVKRSETRGAERRRLGASVHSTPCFPRTCGHGGSKRPTQINWLPFPRPGSACVRVVLRWFPQQRVLLKAAASWHDVILSN